MVKNHQVYLVDRVVPMLPEVLSNNACSLRPHEEKYTFSAVFELNQKAELINQWFGRTVTYSDARFSYEEAQHIIETQDVTIPENVALSKKQYTTTKPIKEAILKLDELAKILRSERMQNGAISFDKMEVKFNLSSNNEPKNVYFKTSKDANKLIEEFMLLANKKVAENNTLGVFIYNVSDIIRENQARYTFSRSMIGRGPHQWKSIYF